MSPPPLPSLSCSPPQPEERRRNSQLTEMLYFSTSNALAPYVFSMAEKYKALDAKARTMKKEKIYPEVR